MMLPAELQVGRRAARPRRKARWMAAHDRIRLTGRLREGPPRGGPSYTRARTRLETGGSRSETRARRFTFGRAGDLMVWQGLDSAKRLGPGPDAIRDAQEEDSR